MISSFLLGLIQGVTEFLPVSSSGHLFLMASFFKNEELSLSFVLFLHGATFISVIIYFFKDIKSFVFDLKEKGDNRQLFYKVLISLLPLFFTGIFFKSFVVQSFQKNFVGLGFLGTGLLLLSLLSLKKTKSISLKEMSFFQAFLIGLAQSIAVFPGFSRSGLTIAVGLNLNLKPREAVFYSFLISLPAIFGSVCMDLLTKFIKAGVDFPLVSLEEILNFSVIGAFFLACLSGILSLWLVVKLVQSEKMYLFSFYLLPLSCFVFFLL